MSTRWLRFSTPDPFLCCLWGHFLLFTTVSATRLETACLACRPLKDQNLTPIHQRTLKQSLQVHVPPIDQEFQRRFPGRPFLLQEARKVVAEMPMTNLQLLSNNTVSDSDLLQRFHEIGPGLEEFLPHAKPGDVFRRKEHLKYWGDAQQQFRNTASVSPLPLQNGKTHIEIGFTDFGTVIDSTAAPKPLLEPLTVLAYDSDPFCVAKTLVMLQMMKNTKTTARNIVEAWINSMWSKSTLDIFSAAISKIIIRHNNSASDANVQHPRVFEFWHGICTDKNKLISVREAEEMQRNAVVSGVGSFFSMTAAVARRPGCFSLVLLYQVSLWRRWSSPSHGVWERRHIGVKQLHANCFEALPWSLWTKAGSNGRQSVVDVARTYFEGQVSMFMEHLRVVGPFCLFSQTR